MRKQNFRIFLMISLFAILAPLSAQAQSSREQTANIPFSFTVGDKTFPAGEYKVMRLNPQSSQAALSIQSVDGHKGTITLTMDIQGAGVADKAKLVFNRYGDQYYLAEVWMRAADTGLALQVSRSEGSLARNAGERTPEQTTVALNIRRR